MNHPNNYSQNNYPYNQKTSHGTFKTVAIVIAAVIGFFLFWSFIGWLSGGTDDNSSGNDSTTASVQAKKKEKAVSEWEYFDTKDEMTDEKRYFAASYSKVRGNGFLDEAQLKILIRKSKGSDDVMLMMASEQFHGSEYYNENYISMRVNGEKAVKYTYNEPTDGDTQTIFISNAKKFIGELKRADSCKIEVPAFREGRIVFDFEFGDSTLVWK